jgi:bifunctional DNA primase/polymerase-like protein/primase-like protein
MAMANIGVPTGLISRLLVVDVDPRNGAPRNRVELVDQFGPIPETAEQITGGGGMHLFFRYSGQPVMKKLAVGIDLKADGGYVLVAPSTHPSGNRYEWVGIAGARAILNPAEPPMWLMSRIGERSCIDNEVVVGGRNSWARGERNNKLTSLAGTMHKRGMGREAIEAALFAENRLTCKPPLPRVRGCADCKKY